MNDFTKNTIIELYSGGKSAKEIEKKLNIPYSTIYILLKSQNLIRLKGNITLDGKSKLCSMCKKFKSIQDFHKRTGTLSGLAPSCKDCSNSRNKETRIPYSNLDEKQKKLILESNKKSRDIMPLENKIFIRAKKRSRELNLEFNLELSDIIIPKICPILDIDLIPSNKITDNSPSIDRIKNNLGYIKGNIHIISNKANRMKSNGTKEELEKLSNYFNNI